MQDLDPGDRFGPFVIESTLGAGGMGRVYRAVDTRLGRRVALKLLAPDLSSDPRSLERFRREARAAAAIDHPNICAIYEIGEVQGQLYLALELLRGAPLSEVLATGPMSIRDVVKLGSDLAGALDAAHSEAILHRDIKPGNVFITASGRAKLLDFGLAKLQRALAPEEMPASTAKNLTGSAERLGTVAYMSPEQARGDLLDGRSDLFSLGAVLFEASTGRRAFPGSTPAVVFDAILNRPVPAPSTINQSIPAALDVLIAGMLEKDVSARPATATRVGARLAQIDQALESGEQPATPDPPLRRRRFPNTTATIALGCVLVVALAVVQTTRHHPFRLTDKDTIILADFENRASMQEPLGALQSALSLALDESPYLSIVSRRRVIAIVADSLGSVGGSITPGIGRSAARITGSKAVLSGWVLRRGLSIIIGLEATDASNGEIVAVDSARVDSVQQLVPVLRAQVVAMRARLGESQASIRETGASEREGETVSLACLDAMRRGWLTAYARSPAEAIPYYLEALHADSTSVAARVGLLRCCFSVGDDERGYLHLARAYSDRAHASLNQRLEVEAYRELSLTHDMEAALAHLREFQRIYPRSRIAAVNGAYVLSLLGRYDEARTAAWRAVQLDTSDAGAWGVYVRAAIQSGRITQAETAQAALVAHSGGDKSILRNSLALAVLHQDAGEVERLLDANPEFATTHAPLVQAIAASFGQLGRVDAISRRLAEHAPFDIPPAEIRIVQAKLHGDLGDTLLARTITRSLDPDAFPRIRRLNLAYTLALYGNANTALSMARRAVAEFPHATLVNRYDLPCIEAAIMLRNGDPAAAYARLEDVRPLELGGSEALGADAEPILLRARALSALSQHAEAVTEYRRLFESRNITVPSVKPALGWLGVAREEAALGHSELSYSAYEELFRLWMHADPGLELLVRARTEFERMPRSEVVDYASQRLKPDWNP